MEKKELIKKLAKDYKKYWEVELFRQQGWVRKICKKCGKAFWTIDVEKQVCGDVPCVDYSFIGKPPTKKRLDYIETWKEIERFFVKNGHHSVPSYPVVCRWFPGLYFTIASIVAFQRAGNDTTFEFPHNPLIIPQACLRFNDIPNVGRTGKHFTNFVMIGQHARPGNGGYWKDRCIELDYRLLTEVFGIKKEDITWIEDAWIGPAAFGYSLEWMVAGLELGNAVFTEFLGTLQSWKKMERPVVDMGAGLERLCWITQGTPTAYEAVFGPVLEKMKKGIDYDKELFTRYARLAGGLNLDDVTDIEAAKVEIAKRLGISFGELDRKIGPLEAIFAIADHIKTLLFAAKDGSIPSNVGGGYNLRVVLRRAIDLREKYNLEIDFMSIAEGHARWLKPLFPDLLDGIETLSKLLSLEEERYKQTKARGKAIISDMLKKGKPSIEKMIEIYESHGVPPEMVRAEGEKHGLKIDIPDDFYTRLSARHMTEVEERKEKIELPSLPPTKLLFYEDDQLAVFEADVLGVFDGKAVVLSQTAFYPEGGGQEADHGWIIANGKKYRVYDVKKIGDVVVHFVEGPEFKKGQKIKGEIDKKRRDRLRRHHTAVHIINLSARRVLGGHVWQAGSGKSEDKAHLDITHYQAISDDEAERIEKCANEIVARRLPVHHLILPRAEAEERFGMRIYQGGAVPAQKLRIIGIAEDDWEACGGLHCRNTSDVGKIIITSTERIQDGIVRINIKAGDAAKEYEEHVAGIWSEVKQVLSNWADVYVYDIIKSLRNAAGFFSVSLEQLPVTIKRFIADIGEQQQFKGEFVDFCKWLFEKWKQKKKVLEKQKEKTSEEIASQISVQPFSAVQIDADRKTLILIAAKFIEKNPKSTILLWNGQGDVVCMSKTKDAREVLKRYGIVGGGSAQLAQGKAEIERLKKITSQS